MPEITVSSVRSSGNRIEVDVAGSPLWYESDDRKLLPHAEVFASALLVPALARGANLVLSDPLSSEWCKNAAKLMEVYHEWWEYRPVHIEAPSRQHPLPLREERHALFFSGGVDAFFSLLRGPYPIRELVWIHGFDLPLGDPRAGRIETDLREVAAVAGLPLVVVRTNFRQHPLTGRRIRHTFGGLLASVAHTLPDVSDMVLSASYDTNRKDAPAGVHWRTDPLWASEALRLHSCGSDLFRNDKIRSLLDEPLMHRSLRVCHEGRVEMNCGRCEKCLRSMLVLVQAGRLKDFPVFAETGCMAEDLDRIPFLKYANSGVFYEELLEGPALSPSLDKAVRGLLERTRRTMWLRPLGIRATRAGAQLLMNKPVSERLKGFVKSWSKSKKTENI
jgi:hypothetical protein